MLKFLTKSLLSIMLSILFSVFSLLILDAHAQILRSTSTDGVGAVYTMTNGLIMNQVIVFRIHTNGQLTRVGTVDTNGIGGDATTGDPFFSQGAIEVFSNYLFVVNAGSNSLSMFQINPSDPTELSLIGVQPTYGWFPISVTVNSEYACVLTGGNVTGIRCYTYDSQGLFIVPSFDRDLTSYISQTVPPSGPRGTMSEILFSPDGRILIIALKGYSSQSPGYLLLYRLSNNGNRLSVNPIIQRPIGGILPFSMTLVGTNGLLITDPGAVGVLTLTYSSASGLTSNHAFTPIDKSITDALCWSTYSPRTGNYYVIGALSPGIVELNVDLTSSVRPVEIVQAYRQPSNTGALDGTVVSLQDADFLYVIGPTAQVIVGYRLDGAGKAAVNGIVAAEQGNIVGRTKIAGIAAFISN